MRISDWSSDVCSSDLVGANAVQAYGKGAIVGEDGELEHGAVWHEAGGWALREALGDPKAIVPAAKTIGALGTRLMIPLGHIRAAHVWSHFPTAEMTVRHGPRRRAIAFGLAVSTGRRGHARIDCFDAAATKCKEGLRQRLTTTRI